VRSYKHANGKVKRHNRELGTDAKFRTCAVTVVFETWTADVGGWDNPCSPQIGLESGAGSHGTFSGSEWSLRTSVGLQISYSV
jgi:hypothetical protein